MKIAIVHEWFVNYAGSERVVEQMLKCFPQADLFAVVDFLKEDERGFIMNKPVTTSFIQSLPMARTKYRTYLPLMPLAVEQFDLSAYDVILSSSHAVAKGVLTGPDQLHISYVHSPIRYAWDLQHQYLQESGLVRGPKAFLARALLHKIRLWDTRTANGVDYFLANSGFIGRRIHKTYRREAEVLYPPVDVRSFQLMTEKEDFYLTASRMVPYKKIELIVDAFNAMPERQLVVIGDGPDLARIVKKAGPNIRVMGYQPFSVLKEHMQKARAFVFAAEEDFGITPVEAQACGTPVIAFGKGGALETIRPLGIEAPTGVFFPEQTAEAIVAAVKQFEADGTAINPYQCRANALRFSEENFRARYTRYVEQAYAEFKKGKQVDYPVPVPNDELTLNPLR
jgi:glycosyltransferase involved in cell wall biosynthesis